MIYLDHAATSFPKSEAILEKTFRIYREQGCSPGRGGYDLAVEAEELVHRTRKRTADFFGATDPDRVIFAANATDALNLGIFGLTAQGGHVVTTRLEHNSVLRPLHHLRKQGRIEYTTLAFNEDGFVDPARLAEAITPQTSLVVVNHASNVLGTIQDLAVIGPLCAERGVPLLVDAAQSAAHTPIRMHEWCISALAFTGHKAIEAPTGIGGLVLAPDLPIAQTRFGGTGVDSGSLEHTPTLPHRLEAGTLNMLGIIGLSAALDRLHPEECALNREREISLLQRLEKGLADIDRITVYPSSDYTRRVPLTICNIEGISALDVGDILDGDYGIAVRTGLHCAPLVHESLGLSDRGAVRFSWAPRPRKAISTGPWRHEGHCRRRLSMLTEEETLLYWDLMSSMDEAFTAHQGVVIQEPRTWGEAFFQVMEQKHQPGDPATLQLYMVASELLMMLMYNRPGPEMALAFRRRPEAFLRFVLMHIKLSNCLISPDPSHACQL